MRYFVGAGYYPSEDGWDLVDACRFNDRGIDVTELIYERGDETLKGYRINGDCPPDSQLPKVPW